MIGNYVNNQNGGRFNSYPQQNLIFHAFVQGIEGARAFQMPYGYNTAILWDTESDLFYVKKIDQMGRPYIEKTCQYHDVEPEPAVSAAQNIDTTQFITKEYFDQVLSQLIVGEKGRVVRDEPNG